MRKEQKQLMWSFLFLVSLISSGLILYDMTRYPRGWLSVLVPPIQWGPWQRESADTPFEQARVSQSLKPTGIICTAHYVREKVDDPWDTNIWTFITHGSKVNQGFANDACMAHALR